MTEYSNYLSAMDGDSFLGMPRPLKVVQDVEIQVPANWLNFVDYRERWPTELLANYVQSDLVDGLGSPLVLADQKSE